MGIKMLKKVLVRVAKAVLGQVMSQLMAQFNVIQNAALAPMRAIIGQVTGGVWRGNGADAFVAEVSNLMIPGVGRVGDEIKTVHDDLGVARDVMDNADNQIRGVVSSLERSFAFFR
jgi:hypothetical protein